MAYHYQNSDQKDEPYVLPSIEVFYSQYWRYDDLDGESHVVFYEADLPPEDQYDAEYLTTGYGWFYASGFPGCLWDSDPVGPYSSESAALYAARREL